MCLVPDGDLFTAIRHGTGRRGHRPDRTLHRDRARARSGDHLDADIVVTATGLNLQIFGGDRARRRRRDGRAARDDGLRALMLSGVPNFAFTIGYTNASWTLKADLVAEYVVGC